MVSSPLPPITVSITVFQAMAMLLTWPLTLLNEPGSRLMVAGVDQPETSSVLFSPPSHIVMKGFVLMVKSKKRASHCRTR